MNHFAENIKSYRTEAKLTQAELANQLGVSTNVIGHWEKGRTEPNLDTLLKLCDILQVSLDELIR